MKLRLMIIVVAMMCAAAQEISQSEYSRIRRGLFTNLTTNSDCVSCINSGKWCSYEPMFSYGQCCDPEDEGYYCGGTGFYGCNTKAEFNYTGGFALCPNDDVKCGIQSHTFLRTDLSNTFSSNSFGVGNACTYRLMSSTYNINAYKIRVHSLRNAEAHIYTEENRISVKYEDTLESDYETKVKTDPYTNVYVVVIPYMSDAYINFTATSDHVSSKKGFHPDGLFFGAIFGGGFAFLAILICLALIRTHHINQMKKKRALEALEKLDASPRPSMIDDSSSIAGSSIAMDRLPTYQSSQPMNPPNAHRDRIFSDSSTSQLYSSEPSASASVNSTPENTQTIMQATENNPRVQSSYPIGLSQTQWETRKPGTGTAPTHHNPS